jgi:hypothetical protein
MQYSWPWSAFLVASVLVVGCSKPVEVRPVEQVQVAGETIEQTSIEVSADDWPWWGGPAGTGVSTAVGVPLQWSESKNVVWKADVPGRGHSTPIVVGDRIVLTTADEDAERQMALCYSRQTGEPLWNRTIHEGNFTKMHKKNSHASATPASDGEQIYTVFINDDALWVTALDLTGEIVWQREAGPFESEHGYGSSPVLYGSLVIVNGDNMSGCFVAALDRQAGDVVWRTPRDTSGRHGSYATPTIAHVAGKAQLILTGMSTVSSYDPATGELIWKCQGPAEVTAGAVSYNDRLVFASGGFPEKEILAIRADGAGDVTDTHVEWRESTGATYVPSPVYLENRLYIIADNGVASCFEGDTGRRLWRERLDGNFSASLTLVDGHLIVTNEVGKSYVLKAADKFQIVAENELPSGGFATAVACREHLFLRTGDALLCLGDQTVSAAR